MAAAGATKPVEDTVRKVNDEIAVGSDLEFQRRWWRWENAIWWVLAGILLLDLMGCFGRGPVANAHRTASDGTLDVRYERIARHGTPSIMRVQFGLGAVHEGAVELWTSESLVEDLGNEKIAPRPERSVGNAGGLLYRFPVTQLPATVVFTLQPASMGQQRVTLRAQGGEALELPIFVMP